MTNRFAIAIAATVLATLAGCDSSNRSVSDHARVADAAPASGAAPRAPSLAAGEKVVPELKPIEPPTPAQLPASNPPAAPSKAAVFDSLAKSGKPTNAFAAFQLVNLCRRDPDSCGDLTAGQRTQEYVLLNRAVAASVPGSAVYLIVTTPDGRAPWEVEGDPAYDSWRAHARGAVVAAAERGDRDALGTMVEIAAYEGDNEQALMYLIAYGHQMSAYKSDIDRRAEQISSKLTPTQAAAAMAAGHVFAKRVLVPQR